MELPKRKSTRLKGYDYSQNGAYFITICTHNKQCILSDIVVGEGFHALPQNQDICILRKEMNKNGKNHRN